MLRQFFTLLLCTGVSCCFSQSHVIKACLGYGHQENPGFHYSEKLNDIESTLYPSDPIGYYQVGYAHEKANNRITEFLVGGNIDGWQNLQKRTVDFPTIGRIRSGNVHFQQEFKRKKCFDEKWKSTVYGGFFYNLSWSYADFESSVADIYNTSADNFLVRFGFVPGTQIKIGKRWMMDLNIAASFFSYGVKIREDFDPAIPVKLQKTSISDLDFHVETMLRVGVGYRLGKV